MDSFLTPKADEAAYESVQGDEEDASLQGQPQSTYNPKVLSTIRQWGIAVTSISILSTALITCILLLLLVQVSHVRRPANNNSPTRGAQPESTATGNSTTGFYICGNSPSEARDLGCSFDSFANAWIPASCYDPFVASNSESGTAYPVFWDSNHTRPATQEDLEVAAFTNTDIDSLTFFYTPMEWHIEHCLHLWRLGANAAENIAKGVKGVGVYAKAADLHHAMHCSKTIMEFVEGDGKYGAIPPVVGSCVGLDEMWDLSYGGN